MLESATKAGFPMRRYLSAFKLLADAIHEHRPLRVSDVRSLVDIDWCGKGLFESQEEFIISPLAQSLFQLLITRFLCEGWHIVCIPPGVPYLSFPGANMIEPSDNGSIDGRVSAQWLTYVLDADGKSPGTYPLDLIDPSSLLLWRGLVSSRCQVAHSLDLDSAERDVALKELQHAHLSLKAGNISFYREFEVKTILSRSDKYARTFFGSAWDLMSVLASTPTQPITPGAWRFPDQGSQALRARVAVVEDLVRAFFLPATFSPQILKLHVLDWQLMSKSSPSRVLEIVDALALAHALWLEAASTNLADALRAADIVADDSESLILRRIIMGDHTLHLPQKVLTNAIDYCEQQGHMDWSCRFQMLEQNSEPKSTADNRSSVVPIASQQQSIETDDEIQVASPPIQIEAAASPTYRRPEPMSSSIYVLVAIFVLFVIFALALLAFQRHASSSDYKDAEATRKTMESQRKELMDGIADLKHTVSVELADSQAATKRTQREVANAEAELSRRMSKIEDTMRFVSQGSTTDKDSSWNDHRLRLARNRSTLVRILSESGPHTISITVAGHSQYCQDLAGRIQQSFREAGWTLTTLQRPPVFAEISGIHLLATGSGGSLRPEEAAVMRGLETIGIAVIIARLTDVSEGRDVELYVGD